MSAPVVAARKRRSLGSTARKARIEWFIDQVSSKIKMTMRQRVTLATDMVLQEMIRNVSVPVVKVQGARGGIVVTERSSPGEYPRADTTQLMKTLFKVIKEDQDGVTGYIGTPLDYGVILETRMNRSFLTRTLRENQRTVKKILTGPIS